MSITKTVAVLHTTPVTISGLKPRFDSLLPGVRVVNYLDESLLPAINEAGGITPGVRQRFNFLFLSAAMAKPDVILCACSSVGGLLEDAATMTCVPARRIDTPMLEKAAAMGTRIGVAATLNSTLNPTVDCLRRCAEKNHRQVEINRLLIAEAGPLLAQGKTGEYNELVSSRIGALLKENDVVVLAQASMAGALTLLPDSDSLPVLTSPESGIAALAELL